MGGAKRIIGSSKTDAWYELHMIHGTSYSPDRRRHNGVRNEPVPRSAGETT